MKVNGILFLVILSLLLLSAASCQHKDIECPGASENIYVVFEWNRAPAADVAGMTLWFYRQGGAGKVWRFDIAGRDGGEVELPSGTYSMLACNNDLPGIRFEDTDNAGAVHATARHRLADGIYANTGMLYSTFVNYVEVTPCGVRYITSSGLVKECGYGRVRCQPDSTATQYSVVLNHVTGIEGIRSVSAILEGVRASMYLENQCPSDTSVALWIDMALDSGGSMLSGRGCAFSSQDDAHYRLTLRALRTDGRSMEKSIELKPENINIVTQHNVIIIVDGVNIPNDGPSAGIGGIGADVEGWEIVNIYPEASFP